MGGGEREGVSLQNFFFFPNGCKSFTFYIHAMEDGEEGGGDLFAV